MTYTHLTQDDRYQIHALKRQNISLASIAAELQRDRSTISRELKRNAGPTGYKPTLAHKQARARQCERRNARHFSSDQWCHVDAYLRLHLSPQQCSGRRMVEKAISISAECIYQHAYQNKATGRDLVAYLRCQKVRRKRYASGQERRGVLKWTDAAALATGRGTPSLAKGDRACWSHWWSGNLATPWPASWTRATAQR